MPGSAPPLAPSDTDPRIDSTTTPLLPRFALQLDGLASDSPARLDLEPADPPPLRIDIDIDIDTAVATAPLDPAPTVEPIPPVIIDRFVVAGRPSLARWQRARDLAIAIPALVVVAPVVALVALAVLVCDGRPVFFRQRRVGRHDREFTMVKFRSMVRDAEAHKAALVGRNERGGPLFKVSHDPRVTRLGRVLRDTSLDELPQLWNVIAGHMSLVGPRPALPEEVAAFDGEHRRRHDVRPGMTGLWQVAPVTQQSFAHYRRFDLQYLAERSMRLDLRILFRTATRVGASVLGRALEAVRSTRSTDAEVAR